MSEDARSDRVGAVTAPAASLVRFVLLIAAALATGALAFISIYSHVPGQQERLTGTIDACLAAQQADPAYIAPATADDVREVSHSLQACVNPVLLDWAGFVGAGLVLLFGVAGAVYLVHPWWIIRRRRLRRLSPAGHPALIDDLDRLGRTMRLARSPDWYLAPYARTTGGQAFGLPRRRHVQIDAGLAVLRVTNPPAFRAVVLHELAHLRNRDVDKTYLTIATWRAFTVVVLLPYLVLMLHPRLIAAPLDWRWPSVAFIANPGSAVYRLGSFLALTAVVVLTRNAILRVRETHADATAAAVDGPDSALPSVLGRLPSPPRWLRWGTHPHPRQRLEAVRDPRRLMTAGLWELVGVGIATGLVCVNVGLLAGSFVLVDPTLAVAMVGLLTGALAAGLLAVAIWRTTARDPAASPSWRTWLACPVGLVGGYVVGSFLTLREASSDTGVSLTSRLIAMSLLATGAVFLAAWTTSATRAVMTSSRQPRWAMPAVVAVTVFVGAVWFAVWLPYTQIEAGFADGWGPRPAVGAEIGWYAWLGAVTSADFGPMIRLVLNPLTLPGLTLMWLVPVLVGARGGTVAIAPLRRVLIAGLVGAACVLAAGVGLPFAARAALPAQVRAPSDAEGLSFLVIHRNTGIAIASIAVAVVMTVIVARGAPYRPVLAVLAGCLTTVLSVAALAFVGEPIACYANVGEVSPPDTPCFRGVPLALLAERAHWLILQALLVAVPAMVIAAAARHIRDRRRAAESAPTGSGVMAAAPTNSPGRRPVRIGMMATWAALTLLVIVAIWFGALVAPGAYRFWLEQAFGPLR